MTDNSTRYSIDWKNFQQIFGYKTWNATAQGRKKRCTIKIMMERKGRKK